MLTPLLLKWNRLIRAQLRFDRKIIKNKLLKEDFDMMLSDKKTLTNEYNLY